MDSVPLVGDSWYTKVAVEDDTVSVRIKVEVLSEEMEYPIALPSPRAITMKMIETNIMILGCKHGSLGRDYHWNNKINCLITASVLKIRTASTVRSFK